MLERVIDWLAQKASDYLIWVHERERRGMPLCPDCNAPEIDCFCERDDRLQHELEAAYDAGYAGACDDIRDGRP